MSLLQTYSHTATGVKLRGFLALEDLRACACTCEILSQVSCFEGMEGAWRGEALIVRPGEDNAQNAALVARLMPSLRKLQIDRKVHDVGNLKTKQRITLASCTFAESLFLGAALASTDLALRIASGSVVSIESLRTRKHFAFRQITLGADLAAIYGGLARNAHYPALQAELPQALLASAEPRTAALVQQLVRDGCMWPDILLLRCYLPSPGTTQPPLLATIVQKLVHLALHGHAEGAAPPPDPALMRRLATLDLAAAVCELGVHDGFDTDEPSDAERPKRVRYLRTEQPVAVRAVRVLVREVMAAAGAAALLPVHIQFNTPPTPNAFANLCQREGCEHMRQRQTADGAAIGWPDYHWSLRMGDGAVLCPGCSPGGALLRAALEAEPAFTPYALEREAGEAERSYTRAHLLCDLFELGDPIREALGAPLGAPPRGAWWAHSIKACFAKDEPPPAALPGMTQWAARGRRRLHHVTSDGEVVENVHLRESGSMSSREELAGQRAEHGHLRRAAARHHGLVRGR